jgi:hemoglobin-like flavoprotein
MPNKALSNRVKAQIQSQTREQKIQAAVAAYAKEQEKPVTSRKGVHTIATKHGIPSSYKTITNRYNGM